MGGAGAQVVGFNVFGLPSFAVICPRALIADIIRGYDSPAVDIMSPRMTA
jgi:hypothetical protein